MNALLASIPFNSIEAWAQIAIGRVIHSLPEGLLLALFAWAVLRILPKQNSRTRFAVWFTALLAVVGLAAIGGSLLPAEFPFAAISQNATLAVSQIHLPAHWAGYLFIAWVVIASLGMARLAAGLWHLREVRKTCAPVNVMQIDPAIASTMETLNAEQSLGSRRVTLVTSDRVRVPSALGLWKPVIALPWWAIAELPASELVIILRHEHAHLRRWDDWTNLVQKVVRALFFFHPAVWWIENRLSVEREMACDDIVVAETDNPMGYANCLVNLLERSLAQRGWTMAQAIVHRAREASERVAQILDKNRPTEKGISKPALGLVGTFAALCAVMLPATPQFVAFDGGTTTNPEYAAAFAPNAKVQAASYQKSLAPAVISAGLKTESTGVQKSPRNLISARNRATSVEAQHALSNLGQAHTNFGQTPNGDTREINVLAAEANLAVDQDTRAATPRIVLVRETELVTAEVPVPQLTIINLPHGPVMIWTVQMMRVTFRAPVWREHMQVPAASKT
jgi:beta-lactamase regulating signal transducer with metallopeptidase domain